MLRIIQIVFLSLILLLSITQLNGQKFEDFLEAVIYFEFPINDSINSTGTGFLIKSGERKLFITNEHTLPKPKLQAPIYIRVKRFHNEVCALRPLEVDIILDSTSYKSIVKINNKASDIAAIDITQIWEENEICNKLIDTKYFANDNKLKTENISLGENIYILGYPSSIYNRKNIYPIIREGIISSSPQEYFCMNRDVKIWRKYYPECINGFLVDASVFGGSSGSLVFFWPEYLTLKDVKSGSGGVIRIGPTSPDMISKRKNPYVLGIVSGSISSNDLKEANQKIDIGVVFSYRAIMETINLFNNKTE